MLQISMDILAGALVVIINLIALAFSYGSFSTRLDCNEKRNNEKFGEVNSKLAEISKDIKESNAVYFTVREAGKLEQTVDALHARVDAQDRLLAAVKAEVLSTIMNHQGEHKGSESR